MRHQHGPLGRCRQCSTDQGPCRSRNPMQHCFMQIKKRAEKDSQASSEAACYEGFANAGP